VTVPAFTGGAYPGAFYPGEVYPGQTADFYVLVAGTLTLLAATPATVSLAGVAFGGLGAAAAASSGVLTLTPR
jgi:hypothetical protein